MKKLIAVVLALAATVGCQQRPEDLEAARTADPAAIERAQATPMQPAPGTRGTGQTAGAGPMMATPNATERGAADYALAVSRARAEHAAARQRCDALSGESRSRCESTAGTGYEAALADAGLNRTRLADRDPLPPNEAANRPLRQE